MAGFLCNASDLILQKGALCEIRAEVCPVGGQDINTVGLGRSKERQNSLCNETSYIQSGGEKKKLVFSTSNMKALGGASFTRAWR